MGAVVIIGTLATALTGTLSPADALNGFANTTVWLIFAAFLTHYGTGPAPIYYGAGYVDLKTWWGMGPESS